MRYLNSKFLTKFHRLLFLFFFAFLAFCFLFHLSILVQKLWNFLYCFIVRIINLIREFRKILKFLLKKIEIPYIQNIFRIPSFNICFLNFLVFLTSLFSILPVYGFQKNCKIFVLFYCMDPRFYQKILQNYVFLLKKN